jgi:DUF4097 and DUF4098 domain-containing protein YvlB
LPKFSTPAPISVLVDIGVGTTELIASDRADTVVDVRPTDPGKKSDVSAAEQSRVSYSDGVLSVKAPKNWRQLVQWRSGSVDVKIELPSGSRLRGETGIGDLRAAGSFGECSFKCGAGDISVSLGGPLQLRTGAGDVFVERAVGHSEIATGTGTVHVSHAEGPTLIKSSNGDIWVGEAGADLRLTTANGKISVALARSDVEAKTANGSLQIDEVRHGTVRANTAMGKVEVGVREGVAALLDLETLWGKVDNSLEASGPPRPGEPSVEVRARTSFGDIRVFRASGEGAVESPTPPTPPGTADNG